MTETLVNETVPGMGHNEPNLEDMLLEESAELAARRDQLLLGVSRAPAIIADEETSGKVADLVRLIAACMKGAESARVNRKEPYLASSRLIDAVYKRITDPLDKAKRTVEQRLTIYQRAKAEAERHAREAEAQRAREEAERLRREAEEAAAALTTEEDLTQAIHADEAAEQAAADAAQAAKVAEANAAELSRSRGDYGAVASLRTFWDFRDFSREMIDLNALRAHLNEEDIKKAVRSFIRAGGRELKGVVIFENTSTSVR